MENNGRDTSGKFQAGHSGFKKPKTEYQRLSRTKLGEFLHAKIDDLSVVYDELSPKEKARLLLAVVEYFLPKQRELKVEMEDTGFTADIDYTKLSGQTLKELLSVIPNEV